MTRSTRPWRMLGLGCLAASIVACSSLGRVEPTHHAGETHRTMPLASAAPRSGGDATLRMIVWYPAAVNARETAIVVGPTERPVFIAGRAARDAPWADDARRAVVVASHGFGGSARQLTWLGTALARAGYVVIAVDHPGTNGVEGITAEGAYAPWERARDLRAALDHVAADPKTGPHLDLARVAAVGFSLGGWTALLLAGARVDLAAFDRFCASAARDSICEPQREYPLDMRERHDVLRQPAMRNVAARERASHRDPRVRAAFVIAPALAQALDHASLAALDMPVGVLVGADDTITRPATNAETVARLVPGADLITLPNVGHYDFLSECGDEGRRVVAHYCAEARGAPRARTHATTIAAVRRFLGEALR